MHVFRTFIMFALAASLAAAPVVVSTPAYAQDDLARATDLIATANKAFDAGDFRKAVADYRAAYDITEDARILYRIGICYENLSNYQRAREHLELYLLADPNSSYKERIDGKLKTLRELEAKLQANVRVTTNPPGAKVWVDLDGGPPVGITPVRVPVGPGDHTLIIRTEDQEVARETVTVAASETVEKHYDLSSDAKVVTAPAAEPEATPAPTPAVSEVPPGVTQKVRMGPSRGMNVLGWLSIGVGWALLATSGVLTQAQTTAGVYGSGFFVGAGLLALGSYFLWFKDYSKDLPPAPTAGATHAPQRAMGIGVRF